MRKPGEADLQAIARQAMAERHFRTEFPPEALAEAERPPAPDTCGTEDLTSLPWISIDNDDSLDLDQIEAAEERSSGAIRAYVAVANVGDFVPEGRAVDDAALQNTTSIYTGVQIFPMLPEILSTDRSSLNEGEVRLAVVTRMDIRDGRVEDADVFPALVRNQAKLAYSGVSAFLEGAKAPLSDVARGVLARLGRDPEARRQVLLQDSVARALRARRFEDGALDFETPEMRPIFHRDGGIVLASNVPNRATRLIEEFMIASNRCVAAFLESRHRPCIQRVVATPKHWDRIVALAAEKGTNLPARANGEALQAFLARERARAPETFPDLSLAVIKLLGRGEYVVKRPGQAGVRHFGLGAANYLHGSAPNRRYPDLINQRIALALFRGAAFTADEELEALATWCTQREGEAKKVERQVNKSIAAVALAPRVGEVFAGFITGASEKGVFVRIAEPPVEGWLAGRVQDLAVGDRVLARLTGTDPWRGHLDFAYLKS